MNTTYQFCLIRILFILCLGISSGSLLASDNYSIAPVDSNETGSVIREIMVQTQYSPTSYVFLGKTPNSSSHRYSLGMVFSNRMRLFNTDFLYSVRWHPYLSYHYSKRDQGGRLDTVHGWAFDPLGLVKYKSLNKSTYLETAFYGGLAYVSSHFPTDKGRRLNFTFEGQVSLKQVLDSKYILSLGTSYHHISNAQTGKENPGIDSLYLIAKISYLFTQ